MASANTVKPFTPRLAVEDKAEPPRAKLNALIKADTIFKGVFERRSWRRRDKKTESFESFMVQCAVDAEWEDQEICDLLIDWRRTHAEPFIDDPKHYRKLIDKARAVADREAQLRAIDPKAQLPRAEALRQLCVLLEVEIAAVQRFTTEPMHYVLLLTNKPQRPVELATREQLLDQRNLAGALFDYANVIMPSFKPEEWKKVKALIASSMETFEAAPQFQHLGGCREWLREYLKRSLRTHADRDQQKALVDGQAGMVDGEIWFPMEGLRKSILLTVVDKAPSKGILSVRLQQIGCAFNDRVDLRCDGLHTSRSLWRAPSDILSKEELEATARL